MMINKTSCISSWYPYHNENIQQKHKKKIRKQYIYSSWSASWQYFYDKALSNEWNDKLNILLTI